MIIIALRVVKVVKFIYLVYCNLGLPIVPCVMRCSSSPNCSMPRGILVRRCSQQDEAGAQGHEGRENPGLKKNIPPCDLPPRHKIIIFITVACHASAPIMAKALRCHISFFPHIFLFFHIFFFSPPEPTRNSLVTCVQLTLARLTDFSESRLLI
jgi:hypothetical protein